MDQLARELLLAAWREHAAFLTSAPAPNEPDERLDQAVSILLRDRAVAERLRRTAAIHEASLRLRARAGLEAAHAEDFTPVDPLDALAVDTNPMVAAAAAAAREADAAATDAFGGAALPSEDEQTYAAAALVALAAVLRRDLPAAEQGAFDREVEAALRQQVGPAPNEDAPAALARALDEAGRLTPSALLDLLDAGHVRSFLVGISRLLDRPVERVEAAFEAADFAPVLARHLYPDPLASGRLLLVVARAREWDEDRAGASATAGLERLASLTEAEATALLDALLRHPDYATAIAHVEACR